MPTPSIKAKLTLTVDKEIIEKAKKVAQQKRIPISQLIENFLDFFASPQVYCFKCGEKFNSVEAELCPKCGWMICPECKICRCELKDETAVAVFHMRRVYENLLSGRVKA
jgi:rRNA maturation endonuclease Nob1